MSIAISSFNFYEFILLHDNHFGIISSRWDEPKLNIILLSRSSGTVVFEPDSFDMTDFPYILGRNELCLPGTYANDNISFFPCLFCPAGTKAPGYGSTQCEKCSHILYCSLGSIDDHIEYLRVSQTVAYPESSDSTSFDDIILSNIFSFRCLIVSPIFWMFNIIGIVTLLLIIISLSSAFPRMLRYRLHVLRVLSHVDLVSEGHLWIGRLVSSGIFSFLLLCSVSNIFIYIPLRKFNIHLQFVVHQSIMPSLQVDCNY